MILPIQITRNPVFLTMADIVVKPLYPEKPGLFGPRAGSISPVPGSEREYQVVCPREYDEEKLRRVYCACVRFAKKQGAGSLALPLLPEGQDAFPGAALALAAEALGDALEACFLRVYLVIPGQLSTQLTPALRRELTDYIDRNTLPTISQAPRPFVSEGRPFPAAAPDCAAPMPPSPAPPRPAAFRKTKLDRMIFQADAGFSETLLELIDKTGKKDSEIYSRANVSRQHFSKIRNNPGYKPTKATAIAFAIALELDMAQTRDLIGRAGYALTRSSVFDLIIMYFIENKNYDLYEINEALYEFDQNLLGV